MSADDPVLIVVAAGVIETPEGFLMTRRLAGTHLEGRWEFPGGKCEAFEDLETCLRRELREELALDVSVGATICVTRHAYVGRQVELHFFRCRALNEPRPLLGQQMRWVPAHELTELELPDADAEIIARLVAEASLARD